MDDKNKQTRDHDAEGNAFQINDEPTTDDASSQDKEEKNQGDAFQINGDPDKTTTRDSKKKA